MPHTPTATRSPHTPDGEQPPHPSDIAASPDGRTRYSNGERRRTEILDAAIEIFAQRGFQGLSLRQIAEGVGVSHTLLRHHFGNKDAILEAVLARREELEADWRDALLSTHGLLEALPLVVEHNATIRGLIQLDAMVRAEAVNPDHPAHDYIVNLAQRFRRALEESVRTEQIAGHIRSDLDPKLTALRLACLIEGVQVEWLIDPSVDMAAVMRAVAEELRA